MSSDNDIVLSVEHISKCYEMYEKPVHRLFQTLCAGHRKFYKEFWALRDISFDVHRGECVGIIGRNGAGKSTLLQIITGTLQPSSGAAKTNGRIAALLELGSGFNPEFTGRENVYMNASILGLTREEVDARFQAILDFADIGDFIDQPVKTYSSGMAVRLAFAVVAHVDADILIVDEALSVGDAFFTQKCMRFIRKFREEHTILFVSHDTGAVVNLCTKAILLENGQIVRMGEPKEIAEYYLAQQFHANQGGEMEIIENADKAEENKADDGLCFRDMRQDFLVTTTLRNDIELLQFNENSNSFGTGQAKITNVVMTDEKDQPLSWVVGGEMVKIKIYAETYKDLYRPIIGFIVKDHLGQSLFAANTCITYLENPLSMTAGQKLCCTFEFRMPILYVGDYSIMVSIAEGTQQENVQHHWLHDAYIFKSHAPEPLALMGIPMKKINMEIFSE